MAQSVTKVFSPVPKELHRRIKMLALKQDRDMQEVVRDALTEYAAREEAKESRARRPT